MISIHQKQSDGTVHEYVYDYDAREWRGPNREVALLLSMAGTVVRMRRMIASQPDFTLNLAQAIVTHLGDRVPNLSVHVSEEFLALIEKNRKS